ncbi:MbtH family protein [Pseudoduganella armeniaca]|uniref:MbtH family protein n=1 Tax=Pseudoduganella armeniaca TaxID=2072590 RepID=A0A2R4CHC7_9BURK|nr:MbtH family NRPS accessory protein [Pseudoduganella armeniaca]AVR98932.1 MbtH family protein [Pseudoduganella armeniaca]
MEQATYIVVKNHEEQYSIWDTAQPVPAGWAEQDCRGSKEQCLAYIRQHWTDMRPASLRAASLRAAMAE